ncbi:spermidine synthase [Ruania zhangjianzhongii]|uniref:spermidine synthase n=1 Tax=Ruania zhangjianzhongii TaxID=2603206 RepID=UPI0011CB6064|nr:hypothetical protein [Ruania zhangjianzhongii]
MRVASAVSARGEVLLRRREDALELRVNGVFVMDTAETSTERALARAGLTGCARPDQVLLGGLGLGFTAAEVLADPRVQLLEVVEIEPAVIDWLADGTVPHGPALLTDPRLQVVPGDIAAHLQARPQESTDLVLLDVDNGPGFLVYPRNAGLYGQAMLAEAARVLRPGGAVVIWSAARAPELAEVLATVFAEVSESALPVRLQGRDEQYWLYTGRVSGSHGTGSPPSG